VAVASVCAEEFSHWLRNTEHYTQRGRDRVTTCRTPWPRGPGQRGSKLPSSSLLLVCKKTTGNECATVKAPMTLIAPTSGAVRLRRCAAELNVPIHQWKLVRLPNPQDINDGGLKWFSSCARLECSNQTRQRYPRVSYFYFTKWFTGARAVVPCRE
jgi:hypothetical protein